jgi:hypothetical protein
MHAHDHFIGRELSGKRALAQLVMFEPDAFLWTLDVEPLLIFEGDGGYDLNSLNVMEISEV